MSNNKIKEKKFTVLKLDVRNRNHRTYTLAFCKAWLDDPRLKDGTGIDIECAIDEADYDYEYLKDELICGRVTKLEIIDKEVIATCQFKTEGDAPYLSNINNEDDFLDKCAIIPKGKGAVKNKLIQDDYELYGFNLIWAHESSFVEEAAAQAPVTQNA